MLAAVAALPAWSTDEAVEQRRRITAERASIEAQARAAQTACAGQFAVTACVDRVRAERRERVRRLDREVAVLDAEDRKRRAAQRLLRIEQRQAASAPQQASAAALGRSPRASEAGPRSVEPAPQPRVSDAAAAHQAAASAADVRAAQRAAASARRASEALAHRAAVEARNRERDQRRVPGKPLPPPSAAAN